MCTQYASVILDLTVQVIPIALLVLHTKYYSQGNTCYHTINNVPGPVHCIAQSGSLLAVSSGSVVQLIKQGTVGSSHFFFSHPVLQFWERSIATWDVVARLPNPPKFPELEGELPEPNARSLHFLGVDDDVLLVTYLDHGIV